MIEHAPFVHLHTHSEYSILDGSAKIDDLIEKALHFHMPALALTDHGNMFGAMEFYKKAMHRGLKPIIGQEFYVAPDSMEKRGTRDKPYHLILLAGDEAGYKNLLNLSSEAFLRGFYYKPRIDFDLLSKRAEGLICLSSCLGGEIPVLLRMGRRREAEERASRYHELFGKNYYFELMNNGLEEQVVVNRELIALGTRMGIQVVATNDVHYLEQSDARYHDVLLCIQTGKTVHEKKRLKFESDQFYFRSPQEMSALFKEYPQAIRNTIEVTEKCNLKLDLGRYKLPHFPIPEGNTADSYLKQLTDAGIHRRYPDSTKEIVDRVKQELEVIQSMGFSTYFLIVWDFIRFAKDRGIAVGPGRGSAAGSIVAFALGITDVDPLKYGLIFERFLNQYRISMPDIDIDFDGDRRDEVIQYVREKYGQDRVAQIITFGAMKARAVVRDVARATDISIDEADTLAKLIPIRHGITIEEAVETSSELRERIEKDLRVKRLFEISRRLERLVRHPSTHAAGVVISPEPLSSLVPLYKDPKSGVVSTQYQMRDLEDVGLIKMDFLGLKNLTIIQRCLHAMESGGLPVPDMKGLDLDDHDVYALLGEGKSMGVFQLESNGMQNLLKRLQPNRFDDIIAVNALYRPGPLDSGMVDEFIERKQGRKPIVYTDSRLREILEETYGVIVYQEQVMEIAQVISGFTMAEADNLRKAMGKKKIEILEEARATFIEGAVKNGVQEKKAEEIFEMIKTFGRYGFNKSHSTAYALLAFQTAYLKVHFSKFYIASLLSGELNDTDKICKYICEAREMGIEIHAPSVNRCDVLFTVRDDAVQYALAAIKNVGENAARNIVTEREERGEYRDLFDFTSRVDLHLVNRRVMESLIKSGAMDCFAENRQTLFENIEGALEYGSSIQTDRMKGQSSLFEEVAGETGVQTYYQTTKYDGWSETEISENEREVLGFYFKAHPLHSYSEIIEKVHAVKTADLKTAGPESRVCIFGIPSSIKVITTKDRHEMAFVSLEDLTGSVEVVVFPSVYEQSDSQLEEKGVIVVTGRLDGEKILAESISRPEEFVKESVSGLHILLSNPVNEEKLLRLRDLFIQNKGKCNVYIHTHELEHRKRAVKASAFLLVNPRDELLSLLRDENLIEKAWVS